jgi:hypothetical protein
MSRSLAVLLAWSVCALSLVLAALGLLFLALNRSHPGGPTCELAFQGTVMVVAWSAVGVLIASRHPAHPIGWLFSALGLSSGVQLFAAMTPSTRWWWSAGRCRVAKCQCGSPAGSGCKQTSSWRSWRCCSLTVNCRRLAGEPLCGSTESWPWRGALRPRSCPGRALLSRP